jgi:nicotinate-nucleotide--dimethylbenzimidazole phosphoribosyltransferase
VSLLDQTVAAIGPPDAAAVAAARQRQGQLTKPAGSLGVLEDLSVQLAGIAGVCPPPLPEPAMVAIFAADHGVHAQRVTPWPQEVTAQMVANFLGSGAVINALAAQAGAQVEVIDIGVAAELPAAAGLRQRKVRPGTADMTAGPAMTVAQAVQAIETGIEVASDLVEGGARCLLTGDMGIANTTASAALIAAFTGADPQQVTGRGTGIDDETLARKVAVVRRALALHQGDLTDPVRTLAAVGGLEHAALAGFLLGAAAARVPAVLDGVIACAAALAARALAPDVASCLVAGHLSAEPGAGYALRALGLRPLLDLGLRLGEGSGAVLALPVVQAAARVLREVATFDSAQVSSKEQTSSPQNAAGARPVTAGQGQPAQQAGHRVLVLGGARSGKSVTAERMLAAHAEVDYIATGPPAGAGDEEWDERVAEHQGRRPAGWRTVPTLDLVSQLGQAASRPVLVDCLSTWLAGVMDECGLWTGRAGADEALAKRVDGLVDAWLATGRHVVTVSNEVGSGVVPATAAGRRFRDELGSLNARIAAHSEETWLCTAGIARRLQ